MIIDIKTETTKAAFIKQWTTEGYTEKWAVYGQVCKKTEEEVVREILVPFYDNGKTVLEIGCGSGYWSKTYLSPNFKHVIALDLLPEPHISGGNIEYHEVPDRNYECFGVKDDSAHFAFSFGVFCHLTLSATQKYLNSAFRKLKRGGEVSFYFSNTDRRGDPLPADYKFKEPSENDVNWTFNNWETTKKMMEKAGFIDVMEYFPEIPDTLAYGKKP